MGGPNYTPLRKRHKSLVYTKIYFFSLKIGRCPKNNKTMRTLDCIIERTLTKLTKT